MNISDSIDSDSLADIISGYAHAQRGSNQLWDFLLSKFKENDVSINSKILTLKSLIVVDYYDKIIYEEMAEEILKKENLENNVKLSFNYLEFDGLFV